MRRWLSIVSVVCLIVAGCLGAGPDELDPEITHDDPAEWQRIQEFKGNFLLAEADEPRVFSFDVPNGTEEVEALLTWSAPGARLSFTLMDAHGEEAARGWHERDGRAYVTNTHPVEPGEWSVDVTPHSGVDVEFTMTLVLRSVAVPTGKIETTFQIPPANAARLLPDELADVRGIVYQAGERDFAEINLNMKDGDWFSFTWEADQELYFNVHYHPEEGGTVRPIEDRATSMEDHFTANWTEVYALLWRNENPTPTELTVTLDGDYRLHSMSRDM